MERGMLENGCLTVHHKNIKGQRQKLQPADHWKLSR